MPHILTLATLYPNIQRPNFGIFVERQTAELASRDGYDVTVVNPIGMPPWPLSNMAQYAPLKSIPRREEWRGLDVHRPRFTLVPRIGGERNPRAIARAILPLIKRIHKRHPIDVIDAEFFYPDGPAAMRISDALGIPYSIKARGADIHFWGSQRGCDRQILAAANKASGLLAVSKALKADMVQSGMSARDITVHYTGLDQQRFKPVDRAAAKASLNVTGPLLVAVGALIPRKNQHLVIRALANIPEATLILAGSGEEESNYRALAEDIGVADRVRFAGNVPHDELPQLLGAADIMVLASQSEGLANAWVEALACGTPIIISEAGGARELLSDKTAGRIVGQNVDAIANAARDILANPPTQDDVRAAVRDFSWKANGDALTAHFEKILAG